MQQQTRRIWWSIDPSLWDYVVSRSDNLCHNSGWKILLSLFLYSLIWIYLMFLNFNLRKEYDIMLHCVVYCHVVYTNIKEGDNYFSQKSILHPKYIITLGNVEIFHGKQEMSIFNWKMSDDCNSAEVHQLLNQYSLPNIIVL